MRATAKVILLSMMSLAVGMTFLAKPAAASPPGVDLYVGESGTDISNNCQNPAAPCRTISYAVSIVASRPIPEHGIYVGAGTYDENVVIGFSGLAIVGQGSSTVVTGSGAQPTFQINGDSVSLTKMSISNNSGAGGVANAGNGSQIVNDVISNNSGAGVLNTGNDLSIEGDLISSNSGNAAGGGITNQGNTVSIANDTIFQNRGSPAGGVWSSGTGVVLTGDTVDSNQGGNLNMPFGGGITSVAGSLSLGGSIVSFNQGIHGIVSNCVGVADAGYNLEDAGSCGFSPAQHDLVNAQPNLAFPARNGGPTETQAIGAGSPAQGAIPFGNPSCSGTDQRGAPRLQPTSTACDMGAFQSLPGYWEVAADGGIFTFGAAPFYGSMGGQHLNAPVVGMAEDPISGGYWEVAADGGIFSFGAPFEGSMGFQHLNAPVVGMAWDPISGGYWEVAADGGIFSLGGAPFDGSMGGQHLNAPMVGMAADPNSGGYWEVAADGGVFAFGGAQFSGSMGGQHLNAPMVGMAAFSTPGSYREVAADGGIFSFGALQFYGSTGGQHINAPMVGMAADTITQGYWEVAADGGVFTYNGAPFYGSMGGQRLNQPIVGMAAG